MSSAIVEFDSITKTFAGVTALREVSLAIARGECHGLMGENGAGKSTLGKILAGIHRADGGRVIIDGAARQFASPADALRAGVGMVHQELAFCPDLSVAENLCMGQYPRRMGGLLDRREMRRRARRLLEQIGVSLDVDQPMRALSTAQEQLVQIAAAVGTDARIIVFDEPTSSLSETEAQRLFELIERLRERGVTTIYVSHRMPEVLRLCDRISVLRDGQYVGTLARGEATQDALVRMMIGRSIEEYFPQHLMAKPGEVVLSVRGLSSPGKFEDVSFDVRGGEIVGFAGLVGAGRSEVAKAIFGLDRSALGQVAINGQALKLRSVRSAMARGVALVPEDRKRQGLVLQMSGRANVSLALLDRLRRMGMLDHARERSVAAEYFERLRVRTPSLARGARVLIVDEPTRGVDVGAKAAIHQLIDALAGQGVAIMLISSELSEVLNLSTRIVVMRTGRIVGEIPREQATQERIVRLMTMQSPATAAEA
jgi:ABC-type sugar transport system ATPase subunit